MAIAGWQQTLAPMPLEQILESAVAINWKELIRGPNAGLIHLEYHIGEDRFIDYLRIWSSTAQGYWSLVCHCSVNPDSSSTLKFSNGYNARELGASLQAIMKHQDEFPHTCAANTDYLVQVGPPSVDATAAAKSSIDKVFGSLH